VQIQADGDVKVFGHGNDATAPVRQSFAAVAAGSGTGDATGGLVDVRSIHGAILATDRAFQSFGRHHNAGSLVRLYAASGIDLSRPGPNSSFNPVVDSSASPSTGTGGVNEIRCFSGPIFLGAGASISAAGSSPGANLLTSCGGVTALGAVTPADSNPTDDAGICDPATTPPLYPDCPELGGRAVP